MEAATLQKKKNTISKGKLKKNIKNVLCRPDQVFWPEITEEEKKRIQSIFKKYSVRIPEYKKPHWKDIKLLPKEERPKPPKIEKVDGLLFGISECSNSIIDNQCTAIIIEATVNPRMIVQPIIEMCNSKDIPLLCMEDLRQLTLSNFGIKTSCLGLKTECVTDLRNEIIDITKQYPKPKNKNKVITTKENILEEIQFREKDQNKRDITESPYLYRTNKKTRVFVPPNDMNLQKQCKDFIGQDFIEFLEKSEASRQTGNDSKTYMKMILKRISNNPNRVKKK